MLASFLSVFYCTGRGEGKVKGKITYTQEMARFSEKLKMAGKGAMAG